MNILTWDFKSGKDFESSFLEWEQEVERFDAEHTQTPIQDILEVGLIMTRLSGQLRNLLFLQNTVDTPYAEVRASILNYIKSTKVFTRDLQHVHAPVQFGASTSSSSTARPFGAKCK